MGFNACPQGGNLVIHDQVRLRKPPQPTAFIVVFGPQYLVAVLVQIIGSPGVDVAGTVTQVRLYHTYPVQLITQQLGLKVTGQHHVFIFRVTAVSPVSVVGYVNLAPAFQRPIEVVHRAVEHVCHITDHPAKQQSVLISCMSLIGDFL